MPKSKRKGRKWTLEEVRSMLQEERYILLSSEYKDCKTKMISKCPSGNTWHFRVNDFQQGHRCPCSDCRMSRLIKYNKRTIRKDEIITLELRPNGHYKKIIDKDWLYRKYVIEERPIEEIGKLANINPRYVTQRAKEYGFPIRTKKRRYELRSERHDSWCKGLTKDTHPSLKSISEHQKKNSHFADPEWRKESLFTPEVRKKRAKGISKALKAKWDSMTSEEKQQEITRIWAGKSPNNTEQLILSLCPSNVEFVGNGQHWVTFKDGRNKNPDFVVRPFRKTKKVIEYFGKYWHPDPEEKQEIIQAYAKKKIECLVIEQDDLKQINKIRQLIADFCENINAKETL